MRKRMLRSTVFAWTKSLSGRRPNER
ncbi:hypothetical protein B4U79_00861 [Dinothrombium tinctorium]|uniref:Uncharacterized protein n=1 Tax=Dinothrombium tinctorium TaxID=1965070 RepID=A0A3S3PDZ0_9ACAR|nr:hypothetical protein B4U79_02057 [Dinothrombium tinctorium]RWS12732.1 hypothetical protein B4U79_05422 [Dinothrombium tinctorium]RWS13305.1 hypothetical protein B4U79_00861 [Dinothrombium tinctorium]